MPDPDKLLQLVELEKLSYLSAVILEALRISYGVSHRLQRVCPDQAIMYHDYELTLGTPVSMTQSTCTTTQPSSPSRALSGQNAGYHPRLKERGYRSTS